MSFWHDGNPPPSKVARCDSIASPWASYCAFNAAPDPLSCCSPSWGQAQGIQSPHGFTAAAWTTGVVSRAAYSRHR